MDSKSMNIYRTARKRTTLSQEQAAREMEISDSAVRCYELGTRVPSADVVERMVVAYGCVHLAYMHNLLHGACGCNMPNVDVVPMQTATMKLVNRVMAFAEKRRDRDLLIIAEDGVVDEWEQDDFDEISAELDGIVQAALELKFAEKSA